MQLACSALTFGVNLQAGTAAVLEQCNLRFACEFAALIFFFAARNNFKRAVEQRPLRLQRLGHRQRKPSIDLIGLRQMTGMALG
jgi:hypothetical protein